MKQSQASLNPFVNSDSNKRYYTYEYYLRKTFGGKCAKLPLDAGFTCPNIDGRCGYGGCIYCSPRGSGDFAGPSERTIGSQLELAARRITSKWNVDKYIAYFQAHTNTYAPVGVLRPKFEEALSFPGVVGMNIATRADCLEADVVEYLSELSERTVLTVELGLQTSNDKTAALINRGHTYAQFVEGYNRLRESNNKINICVHAILGLPGEDDGVMYQTIRDIAAIHPDQIKLHLLHVIKNTRLGDMYLAGDYQPLERTHYITLIADMLELLPPDVVIARLTGDGVAEDLLAPEWSKKKTTIINDIDKELYFRQSMQGSKWSC